MKIKLNRTHVLDKSCSIKKMVSRHGDTLNLNIKEKSSSGPKEFGAPDINLHEMKQKVKPKYSLTCLRGQKL